MATYRIYVLTETDLIDSVTDIDCANDTVAASVAETLRGENPGVEVWAGNRLVYRRAPANGH